MVEVRMFWTLKIALSIVVLAFETADSITVSSTIRQIYKILEDDDVGSLSSFLDEPDQYFKLKGRPASALVFMALERKVYGNLDTLLSLCPDRRHTSVFKSKLHESCQLYTAKDQCKLPRGTKTSRDQPTGTDKGLTEFHMCTIQGAAYQTNNETVIQKIEKYIREGCGTCLSGIQEHLGFTWRLPNATSGDNLSINCPMKNDSWATATWRCGNDSNWDSKPDLSECPNELTFTKDKEPVIVTPCGNVTLSKNSKCDNFTTDYILKISNELTSYVDRWISDIQFNDTDLQKQKLLENVVMVKDWSLKHPVMTNCTDTGCKTTFKTNLQGMAVKAALGITASFDAILPNDTYLTCMVVEYRERNNITDILNKCDSCATKGPIGDGYNSALSLSQKIVAEACKICPTETRDLLGVSINLTATPAGESFPFPCISNKNINATWGCRLLDASWDDNPNVVPCISLEPSIKYLAKDIDIDKGLSFIEKVDIVTKVTSLFDQLVLNDTGGERKESLQRSMDFQQSLLEIKDKITEDQVNSSTHETLSSKLLDIVFKSALLTARIMVSESHSGERKSSQNDTFVKCMGLEVTDKEMVFEVTDKELNRTCNMCTSLGPSAGTSDTRISTLIEAPMKQRCGRCLNETRLVRNETVRLQSVDVGSFQKFNCPFPKESTYGTWQCQSDANWASHPDLSRCRSNLTLFVQPSSGSEALTAIKNITNLYEHVKGEESVISSGDLLSMMEGLKSLQILQQNESDSEQSNETSSYFEKVVMITGVILNVPEALKKLGEKAAEVYTDIQENVEKASLITAKQLKPNTQVIEKSRSLEVRVMKNSTFEYDKEESRRYTHSSTTSTEIELPPNFYIGYDIDGQVVVAFYSYDNLHCKTNTIPCDKEDVPLSSIIGKDQVNSVVLGAKIGLENWTTETDNPVVLKFKHIYDGYTYNTSSPRCVWWDTGNNSWSSTGCWHNLTTEEYTICYCDHLTNLAILMDFFGALHEDQSNLTKQELDEIKENNRILSWLTVVLSPVSFVCLVIMIVSLVVLENARRKKNAPSLGSGSVTKRFIIMMHLCINLALLLFLLLVGLEATSNQTVCSCIAVALHYLLLAVFTWNALNAFLLFQSLIQSGKKLYITKKQFLIVGYSLPLLGVVFTLASFQGRGYGTKQWCWLDPKVGAVWSIAGAIGIIMMINLAIYIRVVMVTSQNEGPNTIERHRGGGGGRGGGRGGEGGNPPKKTTPCLCVSFNTFQGSVSLFLLLGLTWVFGFLMLVSDHFALKVLFTLLNSMQGTGLFVLEILLNDLRRNELIKIIERRFNIQVSFGKTRKITPPIRNRPVVQQQRSINYNSNAETITTTVGTSEDRDGDDAVYMQNDDDAVYMQNDDEVYGVSDEEKSIYSKGD